MSQFPPGLIPEIESAESVRSRRPRPKKCLWTFGIAVSILLSTLFVFLRAGSWLVIQDSLAPADVIVVLSGTMPYRAIEAARLYTQRAAPEVWISQPVSP